jgi:flagellar hook-length control protein FliK
VSLGTESVTSTAHSQAALRRSAPGPGEKPDTSFDEMLDSALPERAAPDKAAAAPERSVPERPASERSSPPTEAPPPDRIEPPAKTTAAEGPANQTAGKDSAATGQPNADGSVDPAARDEAAEAAATDSALLLAMLNPTAPPPVAAVVPVAAALVPAMMVTADVPAVADVLVGSPQPAAPAPAPTPDQTLTPVPPAAAAAPQPAAAPAGAEIAPKADGESPTLVTNAAVPATAADKPAPAAAAAAAPAENPDDARTDDKAAAPATEAPQAKTVPADRPARPEMTATPAEGAKAPTPLQAAAPPVREPAPEQGDAAPEPEATPAGEKPATPRGPHAETLLAGAKPAAPGDVSLNPAPAAGNTPQDSSQPLNVTPTPATSVNTGQPAATPQAQAPNVAAAYAPAVALSGLAVELIARARDGTNRFEIRLDPPELGRIDVHLQMDRDGNVTSRLYVERSETLDLLRRDAPQLERALNQAGLKTSDQGLEFSLRDQGFGRDPGTRDETRQNRLVITDDVPALTTVTGSVYGRRLGLGSGLDIRV